LAIPVKDNTGIAAFPYTAIKYRCGFILWTGLKISIKLLLRRTLQLLLYIQQAVNFMVTFAHTMVNPQKRI
jgi:hypothetical protein